MKRILTTLNEKYFIPQLYSTITICHVSFYIYMIKVKNGKKKKNDIWQYVILLFVFISKWWGRIFIMIHIAIFFFFNG